MDYYKKIILLSTLLITIPVICMEPEQKKRRLEEQSTQQPDIKKKVTDIITSLSQADVPESVNNFLPQLDQNQRKTATMIPVLKEYLSAEEHPFRSPLAQEIINAIGIQSLTSESDKRIKTVAFSPDSKKLAAGFEDHTIEIINAYSGEGITALKGHSGGVNSVAFSPNNEILASGSNDTTIKLWNTSSFTQIKTLSGHTKAIISVAFSPDGKLLASASYDKTIKFWDTSSYNEITTLFIDSPIADIAFSPDGKIFAYAAENITFLEIPTLKEMYTLKHNIMTRPLFLTFSPNSKILAAIYGSSGKTIFWNLRSSPPTFQTLEHSPDKFEPYAKVGSFSPNGRIYCRATVFGSIVDIELLDISSLKKIHTLKNNNNIISLLFSPDGKTLASTTRYLSSITLWNLYNFNEIPNFLKTLYANTNGVKKFLLLNKILDHYKKTKSSLNFHQQEAKTLFEELPMWLQKPLIDKKMVTFIPIQEYLSTEKPFSSVLGQDIGKLALTPYATLEPHQMSPSFAFSPDGKIVGYTFGPALKLVEVSSLKEIATLHKKGDVNGISVFCFSSDGKTVAYQSVCGDIRIWNYISQQEIATINPHDCLRPLFFSPDTNLLIGVSSMYSKTSIWDLSSKSKILEIPNAISADFSPDGKNFAYRTKNNEVILWDLASNKQITALNNSVRFAFSNNNKLIATATSEGTIKIWDLASFTEVTTLPGSANEIYILRFLKNDTNILTYTADKAITIWDIKTKEQIAILPSPNTYSLLISPNEKILVASIAYGKLALWDLESYTKLAILEFDTGNLVESAFSPDGNTLIAGTPHKINVYSIGIINEAKNFLKDLLTKPNGIKQYNLLSKIFERYKETSEKKYYNIIIPRKNNPLEIYNPKTIATLKSLPISLQKALQLHNLVRVFIKQPKKI